MYVYIVDILCHPVCLNSVSSSSWSAEAKFGLSKNYH